MRWIRAAGAAIVLGLIVVAPPWLLIRYVGNPWPAEGVAWNAPLTDGAVIGLLAVVVWVLWAQLMACIVVEFAAVLTSDRIRINPPLTLGVQQQLARRLVTAIAVAAATAPLVGGTVGTADAHTPTDGQAATVPNQHVDDVEETEAEPTTGHSTDVDEKVEVTEAEPVDNGNTITVKRLDSLWSIAERELGDGDRWTEIAALNEGRMMSDGTTFHEADLIRPGWELQIPGRTTTVAATYADGPGPVKVDRGDNLWQIAEKHLDDGMRWTDLYEENREVIGPDPDLIRPGQLLVLPESGANQAPRLEAHKQRGGQERRSTSGHAGSRPGDPDPVDGDSPAGHRERSQVPAAMPSAPSQEDSDQRTQGDATTLVGAEAEDAGQGGITVLRALLASALCLSVGALALVAANRRRQLRRRRIGRMIASTPQELAEVEQVIVEAGSEAQEDVEFLDRALRHLAACCKVAGDPVPQLGAAVLGVEDLTLLFTRPAPGDVPEGWIATADARVWMLPRVTFLEQELEDQPAPYPALVTIGRDEAGRSWLLDLETLGRCGIAGEPQEVADLVRFMVAELAVNAWSEGSEVLLAGQFGETIGLNPARIRRVQGDDALARAAAVAGEMGEVEQNLDADVLTRRRDGLLLDTTKPVVVVLSSRPEGELVADIESRERSRVVVVHSDEDSPGIELTGDGMALLPMWGVSIEVFTLPAKEAEAMSALLASTRNLEDEPVPATQSDDGPLGEYARADGALREEYTEPRRVEGNDPSSLLPDANEVYLATAATTAEDLAAAAPSVPDEVRAEIEALDPTLDQDVADWFDQASPRPKVHLLGPVEVTALNGGDPQAIDNLGGTVSFIAYLACQDRGVTGERAAAACGWKTQRTVQNRATNARFLLGTRPDGKDWLPDASMSDGARRGTAPTYELARGAGGVLNSADLFVRLKFRAMKRGEAGCEEDLVTALSLVTGAPFEAATEHRFKWLFKPGQQRHDEILVGAIHDAAHVLATRGITQGRTDLVRLACDAARKASPHSDIAWLDQAAATEAESGREAAGELVREKVLDRFDEDLSPRSEAIVEQRDWGATG